MQTSLSNTKTKWSFSAQGLKTIAVIAMLINHLAPLLTTSFYEPLSIVLYFIGRITSPIMTFFIVEGFHHTKDINKYTLRLGIFAAVSYLPYLLFINTALPTRPLGWINFNMIFSLLLGLLSLRVLHELKKPALKVFLIAVIIIVSCFADWQYLTIMSVIILDLLYGNLTKQRIGLCIIILMENVLPLLAPIINGTIQAEILQPSLAHVFVGLGMFIPVLLLGRYNGQRGRTSKWGFYIFYPAHLVVIFIIAKCLGITLTF